MKIPLNWIIFDQISHSLNITLRALGRLIKLIEGSSFNSPYEIKELFGVNIDFVGSQAVFDFGAN